MCEIAYGISYSRMLYVIVLRSRFCSNI